MMFLFFVIPLLGDVVPAERLPPADGWPRRLLERRTIPRTRTSAIHTGDEYIETMTLATWVHEHHLVSFPSAFPHPLYFPPKGRINNSTPL